mmetsp:Transcript_4564/g.13818  ORF Transcript_4564/g.13818 Transcript_4564/m.13818 type:complete len:260 (-) Transcript_4564:74-853(-)
MLHRLYLDGVPLQERAAHHDLLGRGQAECEGRAHVAALDLHLVVLHYPKLAVAVKARPSTIEGENVGIAPEHALLAWKRRKWRSGRGKYSGKLHYGGGWSRRRTQCNGHTNQNNHGDQTDASRVVALLCEDHRKVPCAVAYVLVGRLRDPISSPPADVHQLAVALDDLTEAASLPTSAAHTTAAHVCTAATCGDDCARGGVATVEFGAATEAHARKVASRSAPGHASSSRAPSPSSGHASAVHVHCTSATIGAEWGVPR